MNTLVFLLILLAAPLWSQASDLGSHPTAMSSVQRQLVKQGDHWVYTVNERAPTLFRVASELYDDLHFYKDLIRWNSLTPPYHLELGQQLILRLAPTLDEEQGTQNLIAFWKSRHDEIMVQRLSEQKLPEPKPVLITAQVPSLVPPPIKIPTPPEKTHHFILSSGVYFEKLKGTDRSDGAEVSLLSEPSFYLSLAFDKKLSDKVTGFAKIGWTALKEMQDQDSNAPIYNPKNDLVDFHFGVRAMIDSRVELLGQLGIERRLFYEGRSQAYGIDLKTVSIPSVAAEFRWHCLDGQRFSLRPLIGFEFLSSDVSSPQNVSPGYGALVGSEADFLLSKIQFTSRISYDQRWQQSSLVKTEESGLLLTLGIIL